MKKPLVSVIVPCYNQAQYLSEALQSVFDQTYQNWECIIVNDGSPDDTDVIAKNWLEKDARFKYIQKENGGLSSARNAGIEVANGEFILPLDADDKIGSEYLRLGINTLENEDSLKLVYCKAEKFGDESGEWVLEEFSLKKLAFNNMIFCAAIYRKSEWERVGGYDVKMVYGLEDWEFWIAILKDGGSVKCINYIGFFYRIKLISMITKIYFEQRQYLFNYLSVKHADFFVNHYGSFHKMKNDLEIRNQDFANKLSSRKFVIDVFSSKFFGFSIFGKFK